MKEQRWETWMWSEACALVDEAERQHRRFFRLLVTPTAQPTWEPPANIFTSDGHLQVIIALPGADVADVTVQINGSGLLVEARVPPPLLTPRTGVVRLEVPYGTMRRQIELPAGRYRLTERRLSNGCLHLRLAELAR
jgi:HSP20 family protein